MRMTGWCKLIAAAAVLNMGTMDVLADETSQRSERELHGEQSLYWYDGHHRRAIQYEPNLRVERRGNGAMALSDRPSPSTGSLAQSALGLDVYVDRGERMTLPGGVIVKFDASWDVTRIQSWMHERGHVQYRSIIGKQVWLISTAPGLVSLNLANDIHESGDVVYASPNWARPRFTR